MRARLPKGEVPCKVGTQPALCVFDRRGNFVVGKIVRFRDAMPGSKWRHGILTNVDPLRVTVFRGVGIVLIRLTSVTFVV